MSVFLIFPADSCGQDEQKQTCLAGPVSLRHMKQAHIAPVPQKQSSLFVPCFSIHISVFAHFITSTNKDADFFEISPSDKYWLTHPLVFRSVCVLYQYTLHISCILTSVSMSTQPAKMLPGLLSYVCSHTCTLPLREDKCCLLNKVKLIVLEFHCHSIFFFFVLWLVLT